jgi:uncharacterized protein YhjY with autotransporter beta-barrel domain
MMNTGGSIDTSGDRSGGILAQSVGGSGGNGGFSVAGALGGSAAASLSFGGSGGAGGTGGIVDVNTASDVTTLGDDSAGIIAQSVGGGGGNGAFSVAANISNGPGASLSMGGAGGAGNSADTVDLVNTGDISTGDGVTGDRSIGLLAQSVGGGGGNGGFSVAGGLSSSVGVNLSLAGAGGAGAVSGIVTLDNSGNVGTTGDDSAAIVGQSLGGGGGNGGFSVKGAITASADVGASIGGAGGDGGTSAAVDLTNTGGSISTVGDRSVGLFAQSVGGAGGNGGLSVAGGISNSANVNFSLGGAGGSGAIADDVTVLSGTALLGSDIATQGEKSHGILAQSLGGGGGSGGLSVRGAINAGAQVGASVGGAGGDSAVAGAVVVTNYGSTLTTVGGGAHGILAQSIGGTGGDGGLSVSGGINNSANISASVGGFGGALNDNGADLATSGNVTLFNTASVGTQGDDAYGLYAQSVGGSGGSGGLSVSGTVTTDNTISVSVGGFGGDSGVGGEVNLTNDGALLSTLGDGSHGILAQSIGGEGGSGGLSVGQALNKGNTILVEIGGGGGDSSAAGVVNINNAAALSTAGDDAHGIFGQSVGAGGTGGFSVGAGIGAGDLDLAVAIGGTGGAGATGDAVTVINTGATLSTSGDRAKGIFAQSEGGVGGDGGSAIAAGLPSDALALRFSLGGTGGDGGMSSAATIQNSANINTLGTDSHGLAAQTVSGGGGSGGYAISGAISTANAAFGAAIGGAGGNGNSTAGLAQITNTGSTVVTSGDRAYGLFAQSAGGSGGDGGFAVSGSISKSTSVNFAMGGSGGSGGTGGLATVTNNADLMTSGDGAHGVFAQSLGGGGGSGGFAVAGSISSNSATISASIGGSGGGLSTSDTVTVSNTGATLQTFGDNAHGILAQSVAGSGGAGAFAVAGGISDSPSINFAMGGEGGGTDGDDSIAGNVVVDVLSDISTKGANSHGVLGQSVGGGGGVGGFSVAGGVSTSSSTIDASIGGFGGDGSGGGVVTMTTTGGSIATVGDRSYGILAQSVGGSGGDGNFGVAGGVGDSVAVTASVGGLGGNGGTGGQVFVTNQSQIQTGGALGYGVAAQSIGGGGGTGGFGFGGSLSGSASLDFAIGGKGGVGANAASADVDNFAAVSTSGSGSHAILAQSIGGGGGVAGFAGTVGANFGAASTLSLSIGGDGAVGGSGGLVDVVNTDQLETSGDKAHAIFAQSIGGGGGEGGNGLVGGAQTPWNSLSVVVGGSGGLSGSGGAVSINHSGGSQTRGSNASGIFAQSIGGGGGAGGQAALGTVGTIGIGGEGGASGDGGVVDVVVSGLIQTTGVAGYGIFAQSIGGGGGVSGNVDFGLPNNDLAVLGAPAIGNVGLGGGFNRGGGQAGDGAAVTIVNSGEISTAGQGAHGVFAQSVGGGGGLAGTTGLGVLGEVLDTAGCIAQACDFLVGSVGGDGAAGAVTVTQSGGDISTSGDGAHGIFAQSAAGAVGPADMAGPITISVNGNVESSGLNSSAIFAQSLGADGNGDISISILAGSNIQGGSGDSAAVQLRDGAANSLVNRGSLSTLNGITGLSIYGSGGNEIIDNYSLVTGLVDLGGGVNAFNNMSTAQFNMGSIVDLGSAAFLLTNDGIVAPIGLDASGVVAFTGTFLQTALGTLAVDIDWANLAQRIDLVNAAGSADLGGVLDLNILGFGGILPGVTELKFFDAAATITNPGLALSTAPSAIATYEIIYPNANQAFIRSTIDFSLAAFTGSPNVLNDNQVALADYITSVMAAGGGLNLNDVLGAIHGQATVEDLIALYDRLGAEVYVDGMFETLNASLNFSDALLSCKTREGSLRFITEDECDWIRLGARTSSRDATIQSVGYRMHGFGLSGGFQREAFDDIHVGLGFAYERSSARLDSGAKSTGDQLQGGVVVKGQFGQKLLAASLNGGVTFTKAKRNIALGLTAEGEQKKAHFAANVRAAYEFDYGDYYVRPMVDVTATHIRAMDFTERSGGGANLTVPGSNKTFVSFRPFFEVGGEFKDGMDGLIRPYAGVGFVHFFSDDGPQFAPTLSGATSINSPFVQDVAIDQTFGEVSAGVSLFEKDTISLKFGYDGRFSPNTEQHSGTSKVIFLF